MKELLPLGTLLVHSSTEGIWMIMGYYGSAKIENAMEGKYICCSFPSGYKFDNFLLVNDKDIKRVLFYGYQTPQLIDFRKSLFYVHENSQEFNSAQDIINYMNEKTKAYTEGDTNVEG